MSSKTTASFIPIVDKKHLKEVLAAAQTSKAIRAQKNESDFQRQMMWSDAAESLAKEQAPTIKAIEKQSKAQVDQLVENQAETKKQLKKLRHQIADAGAAPLGLPAPPPPAPEVEPAGLLPGPVVQELNYAGPVTPSKVPSTISYSTVWNQNNTTYFGKLGYEIIFQKSKSGSGYYSAQLIRRDADGTATAIEILKDRYEVIINPVLHEFMMWDPRDKKQSFDVKKLEPADANMFLHLRRAANLPTNGDETAYKKSSGRDTKYSIAMEAKSNQAPATLEKPKLVGEGTGLSTVRSEPALGSIDGVRSHESVFSIDEPSWYKSKLVLKKQSGGKLTTVLTGKFDPTFPKLLSERYNPRYQYTGSAIDLFKKFVHATQFPISPRSGKHKLVFGANDDLETLDLYMKSMAAGNKSTEAYNKCVEIADKLVKSGTINQSQYDQLTKTLLYLMS